MKHSRNKVSIALLVALAGFPQISETIYTPALPDVALGLNTGASSVELTLAVYFLGFAFGVLSWGMISDRRGRRSTMLCGLFVYGAATWGCAGVKSIEALLALRFFQAFGASVGSVITQTILRESYTGAERTKLFSVISGALAFSPAIGPVLGGVIGEYFGWRANFTALGILCIILIAWTFLRLPETRPVSLKRFSAPQMYCLFVEMMKSRILWGHILLIGTTNGILFGFYQEAPFLFIEQLGIKPAYYGFFGLLIAGATLLSSAISFRQSGRIFSKMIEYGAGCVLAGGCLFTGTVATGFFALNSPGILVAVCTLFLIFFGVGLIIPASLSHALRPYTEAVGTAGSIFGGCYYCLISVFTGLMSAVHDGTAFPLPLYITVAGIILVFASQTVRPAEAPLLAHK